MSMYIQFFLRADNKFYPIGTYSRSSAVYEMFEEVEDVPWEKITPVTSDMLARVQREVTNNIDGFENLIVKNQNRISAISKMEGTSLEERMDMYEQYEEVIKDYSERVVQLKWVESYISVLKDMLSEAEDTKYYDSIETIDKNKYIYVGIEVGIPTIEDIEYESN